LDVTDHQRVAGSPGSLELSVERSGDLVVAHLRGDLDLHSVRELEAALPDTCRWCRRLVLDLRGLAFIDSSGLHGLVRVRDGLPSGVELMLVRGSPNVHRTFEIVGLGPQFTFVDAVPG
jgi:anti-anti-sigma factor